MTVEVAAAAFPQAASKHSCICAVDDLQGYVSKRSIREHLGWSTHRVEEALGHLLQDGLVRLLLALNKVTPCVLVDSLRAEPTRWGGLQAMIDEGTPDGEVLYWFPCASWDFQ